MSQCCGHAYGHIVGWIRYASTRWGQLHSSSVCMRGAAFQQSKHDELWVVLSSSSTCDMVPSVNDLCSAAVFVAHASTLISAGQLHNPRNIRRRIANIYIRLLDKDGKNRYVQWSQDHETETDKEYWHILSTCKNCALPKLSRPLQTGSSTNLA